MVSRKSSRSKSPRATRSKSRSMSAKRRTTRKTGSKKASSFLSFRRAHAAAIKKEMHARGMKGIAANTKVAKEMFLASGGQMAAPKMRRQRSPSPVRARRASAKAKLAAGASPSLEQKLRALFSRGSPSAYSASGRFMGKRKTRVARTKKAKSPRKLSAYAKWVHEHKTLLDAEFKAAHPNGTIGMRAKFNYAKLKAAHPEYVAKSKAAKSPRNARKARKARKSTKKGRKTMRKTRATRKTRRVSRKSVRKTRKTRKSRATRKTRGTRKAGDYAKWIHEHKAAIKAAHPGMNFMKAATLYKKNHM